MREHSITEDEALSLCREKIEQCVAEYWRIVEDSKDYFDYSLDLRKDVEAVLYCHGGSMVWSKDCPRCCPEAS